MLIDLELAGPIHLSPLWADGGVCLVCGTGQTLALRPLAWEILDFLAERHSLGQRQGLAQYLHDKSGVAEMGRDELESALDRSLAEFERLGVIRRVAL